MSKPGDPEYDEMLEHQTGTEVPEGEDELDPMAEEIAALGPPPGVDTPPIEVDDYNHAVSEIEHRYAQEAADEKEDAEREAREEARDEARSRSEEALATREEERTAREERTASRSAGRDPGNDGTGKASGT
jgi:hypothetical protein